MPYRGEKPLPLLLCKTYVAPFSKEQISAYVSKYQQLNAENKISEKDFSKVPGLPELLTSPFMLHLAVESLPYILANQTADTNSKEMTQAKLYDVFIERWFTRQIGKLRETNHVKSSDLELKKQFWDYCKALATLMHEKQVSVIPFQIQKTSGRLFGKQEQTNPWEAFFSAESEIIRSACPLRRYGEHQYGFVHASLVNYFTNRAMFDTRNEEGEDDLLETSGLNASEGNDAQGSEFNSSRKKTLTSSAVDLTEEHSTNQEKSNLPRQKKRFNNPLYNDLITDNPLDVSLLSDRLKEDEKYKQLLLEILEKSKKNSHYAIGAANAITGLVKAGVHFNGANLSGIKIPGANISGGYFDQANFEGADLRDVHMIRVWLRQASLRNCQLAGINFGEYPWLKGEKEVLSFDYRQDLRRLVSSCGTNIVLWDIDSGKQLSIYVGHEDKVLDMQFSPNGRLLVSVSADKTLRIWDIESKAEIAKCWHEGTGWATCVAFSPDGNRVIAEGSYWAGKRLGVKVDIWDFANKKLLARLCGHTGFVRSIAFSFDGKRVVTGGDDSTVQVWESASGNQLAVLKGHSSPVKSVAFSSDGEKLLSGSEDETVRVWEWASGKQLAVMKGHTSSVNSVAFSFDGKWVVTGGNDKTVRIWDVSTWKEISLFRGHTAEVNTVQFTVDDKRIVSGSNDTTVRIWDVESEQYSSLTCEYVDTIEKTALSANSEYLAVIDKSRNVRIWKALTGKEVNVLRDYKATCVAFSDDGKWVVAGCNIGFTPGLIRIWNIETGKERIILRGHTAPITCVAYSPDGEKLISGSDDETVRIWNVLSGEELVELRGHKKHKMNLVQFTSDGMRVLSRGTDHKVRIWEVASGKAIALVNKYYDSPYCIVAFSFDSKHVAFSGEYNNDVLILDVSGKGYAYVGYEITRGKKIAILQGHTGSISELAFTPDGQRVVSCSKDYTVRIWEISTSKCLAVLKLRELVREFSYHANGLLVTKLNDGSLECWKNNCDEYDNRWQLYWSTFIYSPYLYVDSLRVSDVVGLSDRNRRLLKQRGAVISVTADSKKITSELITQVANQSGSPLHQSPREDHEDSNFSNEFNVKLI